MCRGLETDGEAVAPTELPSQLKTTAELSDKNPESENGVCGSESPAFTFTAEPGEPEGLNLPAVDERAGGPEAEAIHHLASAHDLEQGPGELLLKPEELDPTSALRSRHLRCMEILVEQRYATEVLEEKLQEERERRQTAEEQVKNMLDIIQSLSHGTRVPELESKLSKQTVRCAYLEDDIQQRNQKLSLAEEAIDSWKERYQSLMMKHKKLQGEYDKRYKELEALHLERLVECTKIFEAIKLKQQKQREAEERSSVQTAASSASSQEEEGASLSSEAEDVEGQ
ncbi:unnamed protein product, partial [Symbiodinium pilosum]